MIRPAVVWFGEMLPPDALEAAPGTVSQVRAATQSLVRYAKAEGSAITEPQQTGLLSVLKGML